MLGPKGPTGERREQNSLINDIRKRVELLRVKRALKADIDAEAWKTLYQTISRPFPKPSTGKIAVKVINVID